MSFEAGPPNKFRASILGGPQGSPVITDKQARVDQSTEGLGQVPVPRAETRRENHRGRDRHRLNQQQATLRTAETTREVTLINLSGGGAMVPPLIVASGSVACGQARCRTKLCSSAYDPLCHTVRGEVRGQK